MLVIFSIVALSLLILSVCGNVVVRQTRHGSMATRRTLIGVTIGLAVVVVTLGIISLAS
jgi:hypothetical protein